MKFIKSLKIPIIGLILLSCMFNEKEVTNNNVNHYVGFWKYEFSESKYYSNDHLLIDTANEDTIDVTLMNIKTDTAVGVFQSSSGGCDLFYDSLILLNDSLEFVSH